MSLHLAGEDALLEVRHVFSGQFIGLIPLDPVDETPMRDGKAEGRARRWHETGILQSEIRYEANRAIGVGRFWDERGRLVKTRDFAKHPEPALDTTDLLR